MRVVNVVDLKRLEPDTEHPHGLSDHEYDALFTTDKPSVFAYHGYPWLIHRLTYKRTGHDNLHVRGYKEEGTTTTPFDMVMLNDLDRYLLVIDVIDRVPGLSETRRPSAAGHGRRKAPCPGVHARARRGRSGHHQLDLDAGLNVLVVNAGSESLKLELVSADDTAVRVESLDAVEPREVDAVAHRVVHGGPRFRDPVVIDGDVREQIMELETLAPLHNPPALAAITQATARFPDVRQTAIFDTGFHKTIAPEASSYAGPRRWREEWGIHRYGFHGLSVQWASERVSVPRLVVCHLGGGSSVTAVLDGRLSRHDNGIQPARRRTDGHPLRLDRSRGTGLRPARARS